MLVEGTLRLDPLVAQNIHLVPSEFQQHMHIYSESNLSCDGAVFDYSKFFGRLLCCNRGVCDKMLSPSFSGTS